MSLRRIPLLAIVLIAYNLFAFTLTNSIERPLFTLPLFSGAMWDISIGAILLIVGLILLYIEIVKSTNTTRQASMDHAFSMLVLIVGILEFFMVAPCGTSTFLLIVLYSACDVLAGFQVSIASARRDIDIERVTDQA